MPHLQLSNTDSQGFWVGNGRGSLKEGIANQRVKELHKLCTKIKAYAV